MASAAAPLHNSADPTATRTLREREFRPALTNRFRALKGAIRATAGYEGDFFDLRSTAVAEASRSDATRELLAAADDVDPADESDYEAKRERGAVPAFMAWLREQLDQGVLEVATAESVRDGGHYTGRYIRAAAERGFDDAGRRLVRAGVDVEGLDATLDEALDATFDLPVAQRQLRELYTRTYRDLQGITRDVEDAIREELTQGLVEGVTPREMARRLNNRVDAIGITRAERLARTEVIRSYNEEALTRYANAGVETVTAEVEFLTAGDADVCPLCRSLGGQEYSIADAQGVIPGETHPQCRCTWIPVVGA